MSKKIVLAKQSYDFESDGKRIKGCKITYLGKNPSPLENVQGYTPIIANIGEDVAKCIDVVPALYDIEFEQVAGKNNKAVTFVSDIEFIKETDIPSLFA
ncbi:hypothetical protein Curi_3p00030 (plasmid) [Gottschalkia acidurici 9a]|uniref:Uncharacterized protein n=1 Tax=Gottschalkia acidurici (strain ATCC 7906 / DSM 604 / BCRC 14475 / CIP 104303 / KCTC 5404 / NCIMB 10678 / 9a) TaxID=1128398 RepID=K0B483_GOTA9|nr:hypothetical protein [Gottschalkia acidurici]AFS79927.1 hypothetical protein Curi_3p00030 [Gottschalkia acidurici 9a]